jgi:Tfp pilus assembly protein PilZ
LLKVASRLSVILDRETSSRTSLASFVDHYLRLLLFPADVTTAIAEGVINLFEAEQLARVTEKRLGVAPAQAKRTRVDLLGSHLQTRASGEQLRRRVNELLGTSAVRDEASPESDTPAQDFGDLEDFDPYDPTHLFWDQLKQLGFAFREIGRGDVSDDEIEELLKASEPVMAIVARIHRRKGQQGSKLKL